MNSALRTSRLRKNAIPGLGRAGLQPRRKSRPNIYNKLSCGRRYGGAESPALEFLHFSCDGGLGETAIADLDVEMFDQFGMIDHFFSQQRD